MRGKMMIDSAGTYYGLRCLRCRSPYIRGVFLGEHLVMAFCPECGWLYDFLNGELKWLK